MASPHPQSGQDKPKPVPCFPEAVDKLSAELMGHIADKWTLLVFEALAEQESMRFGELKRAVPGISQKMLTQTLRQMERIGLVSRTVHAVIPPHVDYRRTPLADSLGPLICKLWTWVEENALAMHSAREAFDRDSSGEDGARFGVRPRPLA